MPRVLIGENEYATLYYYTMKKIVHYVIHKPIYGVYFREGLLKGIELLKKNSARKWFWDCKKGGAILKEDMDWTRGEFYPRAVMAGWKYWAVVLPEKIVGQLSMKRLAGQFDQPGFKVEFFTGEDKALAWLMDQ